MSLARVVRVVNVRAPEPYLRAVVVRIHGDTQEYICATRRPVSIGELVDTEADVVPETMKGCWVN